MMCSKCGSNNPRGAKFCCECGAKNEPPIAPSPVPEQRSENVQTSSTSLPIWRKIPGYRSKNPGNMIIATLLYVMIFLLIWAMIPTTNNKSITNENSSSFVMYQQIEALHKGKDIDKAQKVFATMQSKYPNELDTAKAKRMLYGSNELSQAEKEILDKDDQQRAIAEQERIEKEKKLKAEAEAKQKAYEESIKPPLAMVEAEVTLNSISNPQVSVIVKNTSNKTVDAYTVGIYCYDRFGNAVNHYAYQSNRYGGLSQRTVNPGQTTGSNYYWTLHGHENTAKIEVVLEKVHCTDGSTWTPQSNQRVSIKGVLNQ